MISLPYFDLLLTGQREGLPVAQVFDRFVHWGFWDEPRRATTDAADLTRAMERMNALVLSAAELTDGQSVLDCGCGFGGTLKSIDESRRRMSLVGVNIDSRQPAARPALEPRPALPLPRGLLARQQ